MLHLRLQTQLAPPMFKTIKWRFMPGIGSKIRLAVLFTVGSIAVALSLAACAPQQHNETIAGVAIPIPAPMEKVAVAEDWLNLGREQKGEQVSFRGEMSRSELVRFYQDVLPAADWQPDARLGSEIGGYVFTRGAQTIAE
jgi:hypothetical protein